MSNKWQCDDCEHVFTAEQFLKAPNPFDERQQIVGCPGCKGVDGFTNLCDEEDCTTEATCGWNSPKGYRRTCGHHMSRDEDFGF